MNASFIWHSQYNSCFLNYPLTVSSNLLDVVAQTYQKDTAWPQLPRLPQLPLLFAHLDHFLADDRNWNPSLCSDTEVDAIERRLNAVAVHLQCEKHYAIECWTDPRHCQSSVVHFLLLLKGTILAIIPDSCQSLMQANTTEKLVTEILKLENFINELLVQLKPIYEFMVGSSFQEEKVLTKQFFKELNELVQQMPKMGRKKLERVPKLMEYLCLCHSVEEEGLRERQEFGETTREIRKNNRSSQERLTVPYRSKSSTIEVTVWDIFKFNERVRKHSVYHPQKKLTMTSIESKTKPGSIEKDRPPSLERSDTLFSAVKVKSQTVAESPSRDSMNRFNMRERGMTAKSSNSKKGKSQKKTNEVKEEEIEQQRDLKAKKKKPVKITIKMSALSQQISLEKGKSRGWGIVREYLHKKIAERKLRKLLLF